MKKQRTVYSTETGRHCPNCSQPIKQCSCKQAKATKSGDGIVRLHKESKGRGGKPVVIIKGLGLAVPELKSLAKILKAKCGVGGSLQDEDIIIQGDQRDKIKTELEKLRYKVKLSGS